MTHDGVHDKATVSDNLGWAHVRLPSTFTAAKMWTSTAPSPLVSERNPTEHGRISHCVLVRSLKSVQIIPALHAEGQWHEKRARKRRGWHPLKIVNHIPISNRIIWSALELSEPPEEHTAGLQRHWSIINWWSALLLGMLRNQLGLFVLKHV